jgi:hypothetical protein
MTRNEHRRLKFNSLSDQSCHAGVATPVRAAVAFVPALAFGALLAANIRGTNSGPDYFRRACQSVSWHSVSSSAIP